MLSAFEAAIHDLASWVRERFGTRVSELRLFGSVARGEATEDSDVDVAVVIDDLTGSEAREIAHHCGDIMTRLDVIVTPLALSTERMALLRGRERLIARELDRDGVAL